MDTTPLTDPVLLSVLRTAASTRAHCLSTLSFLAEHTSTTPTEADRHALASQQKALRAHLALLRGRHRSAVLSVVRDTKKATAAARSEIDSLHLSLANQFYEVAHLEGEIGACLDYRHTYGDLGLAGESEFVSRHPEWSARLAEGGGGVEHDLMLARIGDEGAERKRLDLEREGLAKKKAELLKANAKRKEELEKADRDVETWLGSGTKVGAVFGSMREKITAASVAAQQAGETASVAGETRGDSSPAVGGDAVLGGSGGGDAEMTDAAPAAP